MALRAAFIALIATFAAHVAFPGAVLFGAVELVALALVAARAIAVERNRGAWSLVAGGVALWVAGDAAFTFLTGQPLGTGSIIALGLPEHGNGGGNSWAGTGGSHGAGNSGPVDLAAPAAPSVPFRGHGAGQFVDAEGGFTATGTATHLGHFSHFGTLLLAPTAGR